MRGAIAGGLTVLACALGCAGSHGGDAETQGAGAGAAPAAGRIDSIDAWGRAAAALECDLLFRCPTAIEGRLEFAAALGGEARCVALYERVFEAGVGFIQPGGPISELRRLEAEGRIHLDADHAQQCLDAQAGCGLESGASTCREVIEGEAELGEPCSLTVECAGDAYCDFDAGVCPGTCAARKDPDAACDYDEECGGEGVAECWPDPTSDSGRCLLAEVSIASGEQAQCNLSGPARVVCPDGLWCQWTRPENDSLSGTCRRPIAIGEPCELAGDVCEADALCHGPEGGRRCQQVQLVAEPRRIDPAGRAVQCALSDMAPLGMCDVFGGWICAEGGICEPAGDGSAGARCDTSDLGQSVPCDRGLYCDRVTRTCAPRLPAGAECDSGAACESFDCDLMTATCRDQYCGAPF